MSTQQQTPPATRWVVATRKGYYERQIRDPEGSEAERAPFEVPAGLKGSWFADAPPRAVERAKARKAQAAADGDIS